MSPEYIASKLALLPQFEVEAIRHGKQGIPARLEGYFSEAMQKEEQGVNLFLLDLRFMEGLLLASPEAEVARTIELGERAWIDVLKDEVLGSKLAFFSNYDRRRLNLVINPAISWTKEEFAPRPALQRQITGSDGKQYRQTREYKTGMKVPDGSVVVEQAWDHEHCIFCLNRIDRENIGFNSHDSEGEGDGEWACEWCYTRAVDVHNPRPLLIPYADRR